jgi:hypothetical protein
MHGMIINVYVERQKDKKMVASNTILSLETPELRIKSKNSHFRERERETETIRFQTWKNQNYA